MITICFPIRLLQSRKLTSLLQPPQFVTHCRQDALNTCQNLRLSDCSTLRPLSHHYCDILTLETCDTLRCPPAFWCSTRQFQCSLELGPSNLEASILPTRAVPAHIACSNALARNRQEKIPGISGAGIFFCG